METQLVNRYAVNMHGVLSCYDRILITGTMPGACYAGGMTSFLYSRGIRIFDYAQFAEPLRERIRTRAQEVCAAAGLEIEHVSKSHIRKEELVQRVLASRGDAPGWCTSPRPWNFFNPSEQRFFASVAARGSGSYLSLLPHSTGSCHYCRRLLDYPIQHQPNSCQRALNSSQKMQRHNLLVTKNQAGGF